MKITSPLLTTFIVVAGAAVPMAPILAQVMAPNADYHRYIKAPRAIDPETGLDGATGVTTQATDASR